MDTSFWKNLYDDLQIPVIVCANTGDMPIVYMNVRANLLFSPGQSVDALSGSGQEFHSLSEVVRFRSSEAFTAFLHMVQGTGVVDHYKSEIVTFDYRLIPVSISGNCITLAANGDHFVLYLTKSAGADESHPQDYTASLGNILNAALLASDTDAAIQMVLNLSGQLTDVSRVYIFEEIDSKTTRNTYEWCADGIEAAIQDLQNLDKDDYPYDVIVNSGMFISDDVQKIPKEDGGRDILIMQGIKAICIIPFYDVDRPLGYVGFDDCVRVREWSTAEIQFLKGIASLLGTLIKRRNAEERSLRSQNVMQIITDNSDDIVYANRLDDYRLVFISQSLARTQNVPVEELLGKRCWEVLQAGQTGPCSFCPIPNIPPMQEGADRSAVYEWEVANTITGHTYLAKDNIVKWVDGSPVHVETATDISIRVEYETQLEHIASTDAMTGVHNREWGGAMLERRLAEPRGATSLCFLDIDGLKHTNDHFGHQAGDDLLVSSVHIIRQHMAEDEFICRWGGDEFILLLNSDEKEATARIATMQENMGTHNQTSGLPYQLSFSYGVVPFVLAPGETIDTLITQADEKMYENKMKKRGALRRRRRTDAPEEGEA